MHISGAKRQRFCHYHPRQHKPYSQQTAKCLHWPANWLPLTNFLKACSSLSLITFSFGLRVIKKRSCINLCLYNICIVRTCKSAAVTRLPERDWSNMRVLFIQRLHISRIMQEYTLPEHVIRNTILILGRFSLCSPNSLNSSWQAVHEMLETFLWDSASRWNDGIKPFL